MMLIFEYKCKSCGKKFERYGNVGDKNEVVKCIHCGNETAYKGQPVFDFSIEGGCVNPGGG